MSITKKRRKDLLIKCNHSQVISRHTLNGMATSGQPGVSNSKYQITVWHCKPCFPYKLVLSFHVKLKFFFQIFRINNTQFHISHFIHITVISLKPYFYYFRRKDETEAGPTSQAMTLMMRFSGMPSQPPQIKCVRLFSVQQRSHLGGPPGPIVGMGVTSILCLSPTPEIKINHKSTFAIKDNHSCVCRQLLAIKINQ